MDAIKPKDFLDQIPKPDGIRESLSVWRRKRIQKGKDVIPKEKGSCSSCLFCSQSGSVYRCANFNSKYYGMDIEDDLTCVFYLAEAF